MITSRNPLTGLVAAEGAHLVVRAVFSGSYRHLDAQAARTFRLLGLHPGPDVSLSAAASLADIPRHQARAALDELTRSHLLAEHTPGRFACHDLLRAYARELAHAECDEVERRAAVHRVLDYYLHSANAANRLLNPDQDPISLPPAAPGVPSEDLANHAQSVGWLRAEHHVLLASIAHAAKHGFDDHAWQIPLASWASSTGAGTGMTRPPPRPPHSPRRPGWAIWGAQARAHDNLGRALVLLGSHQDAHRHLRRALDLYRQLEDCLGQARSRRGLALLFEEADTWHSLAHVHQRRCDYGSR